MATRTQSCISIDCHCDQHCHSNNDCCDDIDDIDCYLVPSASVTSNPNDTLGKTKSIDYTKH